MKKKIEAGDVFKTNEGGSVTVIDYRGRREVVVKHNDQYEHAATVQADNLRRGKVKNPYFASVFGVGYLGVGDKKQAVNGKTTKTYKTWKNMLKRCYCPKTQSNNRSYIGCSVHEDWHNFQSFAEWFDDQYKEDGWQLDKDLLVEGNKIYSPSTCSLIPRQINTLLIKPIRAKDLPVGVSRKKLLYQSQLSVCGKNIALGLYGTAIEAFTAYKTAKETYISDIANKYREVIAANVYESLINYTVTPV